VPKSNKPKVPPTKPLRSAGDSGVPQRGETPDGEGHAPEAGEPSESNRSHGRVIDDSGGPAGGEPDEQAAADENENWESGRHRAG